MSPKHVNASAFIRGLPTTLSARDVVREAKSAGLSLSVGYVHRIRYLARKKHGRVAPRRSRSPAVRPSGIDPRVELVLRHRILSGHLHPPEASVLVESVAGCTRAELGKKLGFAENTLKTHVRTMLRKLDVEDLQDAVIRVLRDALELPAD